MEHRRVGDHKSIVASMPTTARHGRLRELQWSVARCCDGDRGECPAEAPQLRRCCLEAVREHRGVAMEQRQSVVSIAGAAMKLAGVAMEFRRSCRCCNGASPDVVDADG